MNKLLALLIALLSFATQAAEERKVLRLAFARAETSMDPARIVDLYSRNITAHIFESPLTWDHLARPFKLQLLTAESMPQHSPDYKVWTVKIKPGIYFADDPAFKGRKRELVAADYVYSIKRIVDPKNKSPVSAGILESKFIGLAALRDDAVNNNKPFNYDTPIPGLSAPDRYTLRIEMEEPRPGSAEFFASSDLFGAVAREVVEFYGEQIDAHPVGTGPFKLKSWRRSSEIVLERNPTYRERFYEAEPAATDKEGQAILARLKGKRLPMIDEVRVAIIEQSQPMWLSFLNAEVDALATNAGRVPPDFLALAMPGGKIAPYLAKRGIQGVRNLNPDSGLAYFNMEDPVVGGYTPEKIALRRAIALAYDADVEIKQIRRGGIRAQSPVVPHTMGYDPQFKSEMGDYDPARARAGKLQFWQLGSSAAGSDGQGALSRLYGPQIGSQNLARFRHAEFDKIYQRMREIPDGPERDALFLKAKQLAVAYMPYKHTAHRMEADMLHAWVSGYRRPLFWLEWWHMVDIDGSKRIEP